MIKKVPGKTFLQSFKSKKLILTSLVCVIAIFLVVLDKISGSEFLALITANVGVYNASNALAKGKAE